MKISRAPANCHGIWETFYFHATKIHSLYRIQSETIHSWNNSWKYKFYNAISNIIVLLPGTRQHSHYLCGLYGQGCLIQWGDPGGKQPGDPGEIDSRKTIIYFNYRGNSQLHHQIFYVNMERYFKYISFITGSKSRRLPSLRL